MRFHICGMRHCSIHLFWTPISLVTYFSWESLPGYLNGWIRMLPPGRKNIDSTVLLTFVPIATWSSTFCRIWKLHMMGRIWNHAHMFRCFPYLSGILCIWSLSLRQHTAYLKIKWCLQLKGVFIAVCWGCH